MAASVRPSALVLLEHLNLNVVDPREAEAFFVGLLGCVRNPRGSNERQVHFNMGVCQFHMPFKLSARRGEPVVTPQTWPGDVHLWVEGVQAAASDLRAAGVLAEGQEDVVVTWEGTPLRLREAPAFSPPGAHAGGHGRVLHMPVVRHRIAPGAAEGLARWYRALLAARAEVEALEGPEGLSRCQVHFDCGDTAWPQVLSFEEDPSVPTPVEGEAVPEASAYHICVYLESDDAFREAFCRAERAGLLFINERFEGGPIEFASAGDWGEAERACQFRVLELRDPPRGGRLLLRLEHEVRGPGHKSFPLRGPPARTEPPVWTEVSP